MMRILVADDHPLTLNGTKNYIESIGHKVVHHCTNGIAALNYIQVHSPDIAVLDINMPGLSGLEVLQKVAEAKLKTKIILLTMHNESSILNKAREYKVDGYVLKEKAFPDLEDCIKDIIEGKKYYSSALTLEYQISVANPEDKLSQLTLSERKIIQLIASHKTSKQIAELLFLSEKTVEGHRTKIIDKLGLPKEKNALLIWAIQNANSTF